MTPVTTHFSTPVDTNALATETMKLKWYIPLVEKDSPKKQLKNWQVTSHRWGILLAGGDGLRLQKLTKWLCGDNRPKQFCPLMSDRTLLDETRERAERVIPSEQILSSLQRDHERYYPGYFSDHRSQNVVQPSNRGTAPAIASALIEVARRDPDAVVSILPCDHYYSSDEIFTSALESAMRTAEQRSGSVMVLGAKSTGPEVEYGWIDTGKALERDVFGVQGFEEKPPLPRAEALFRKGCLWNTFVMVGRVRAFLAMIKTALPALLRRLEADDATQNGSLGTRIPDFVYDEIGPTDFSRQVLTPSTGRLLALRLGDVQWSDLGDPDRVVATLLGNKSGLPEWVRHWSPAGLCRVAAA